MITTEMIAQVPEDAELVAQCLAGNRDAFGQIVSRYQSLVCSLAYSATGNLGQSEDLAQETFITAWKHLRRLRETSKLRSWLYGIARNRINNSLRREGREPLRKAETLEAVEESASREPLPHDQAMSREEEALLWKTLERIPEIYREPLILYYREHQSIEHVAAALDLTEDAVKQRLARGRKLLTAEVTSFVEEALQRTTPGKAFTVAVLAALPVTMSSSAKAATLGAAAVKGTVAAKSAMGIGLFSAIITPLMGLLGPWVQYRIFLKAATTEENRHFIRVFYRRLMALILGFGLFLTAMMIFGKGMLHMHPALWVGVQVGAAVAYVGVSIWVGIWANGMLRKLKSAENASVATRPATPSWEYRSRSEFLGLPLVHISIWNSAPKRRPIKAWIAVGDVAFGGLIAGGGVAIAPVSFGGCAIGLLTLGGLGIGLATLGGFAVGTWAFGGFALGWKVFGGCAVGWSAAMGGLAVARDFANGGLAVAAQANNEIATQFLNGDRFFQIAGVVARYITWLNVLWVLPAFGLWKLATKRTNS